MLSRLYFLAAWCRWTVPRSFRREKLLCAFEITRMSWSRGSNGWNQCICGLLHYFQWLSPWWVLHLGFWQCKLNVYLQIKWSNNHNDIKRALCLCCTHTWYPMGCASHPQAALCLRHCFALGSKSRNFSVEQCVEISGIFHTSFLIHPHFSSKINAEHDKCYFCYVSGLTTLHLL